MSFWDEVRESGKEAGIAVRAFIPGKYGRDERRIVGQEFDQFRAKGGAWRTAVTFLGPPESEVEAGITAAALVLPGGKAIATGGKKVGKFSALTKIFSKPAAKKTVVVGGGLAAGGAGVALFGDDVGQGFGDLLRYSGEGLGEGLGAAARGAGGGLGEGLKDLIVPGLLVLGAFVVISRTPSRSTGRR